IVSAIISSVAGLAKSTGIRDFLLRMILVFVGMLVAASLAGTLGGIIGHPGSGLDEQTRNTLGSIVKTKQSQYSPDLELSLSAPAVHQPKQGLIDFIVQIVPRNIFSALSSGRALALIFFSIVFGIAIGVLRGEQGESLIALFDGLFKAFQKIISWLMIVLPIGLICLLADQIASTGIQILLAMLKFILIFYVVGIVVFLIDVLIIWQRSRERLGVVLKALLDPIIVSLVTRSSFATLPTAIKSLEQKLGFYERSTNLFLSLGMTLGRFGNIIYFSIAALFVAQLYGVNMDLSRYAIVVVGSLFAGLATAGASGIATLNLLSIVLGPLGLPIEAVLIIFIAIDAIADPLRTMLIVLTNMAANALIVPKADPVNRRRTVGERAPGAHVEEHVDLLTRIRNRGELIALAESRTLPPLYQMGEAGVHEGSAVEAAAQLAAALGVKLRLDLRPVAINELILALKEGDGDLLIGGSSLQRIYEEELAYSEPYLTTRDALLTSKATLANLRTEGGKTNFRNFSYPTGVLAGSIHSRVASQLFPAARLREFEATGEMVDALISGEIQAAFGTELELNYWMSRRPLSAAGITCVAFSNRPADYRFSLSPDQKQALASFNELLGATGRLPAAAEAESRE
ncbi:MAG TPA: cation:dicarboxylase symporter family transporter, partial [Spirochaetia bacterium]|nr:cation:dicarboxylase symporter family transporter [Spirochaetia bacterium]